MCNLFFKWVIFFYFIIYFKYSLLLIADTLGKNNQYEFYRKKGKENNFFDRELVSASAKMIKEEWKLNPLPNFLTYVPSHRSDLVEKFSNELADELGIECICVVQKIKTNKPQKKMENSNFRCKNLDGMFDISTNIPKEPILLVDDVYDSGWTFSVNSALLKKSGSGKVYPFAVASSSIN